MFRPALFSILFLALSESVLSQDSQPSNFPYDPESVEFWDNARVLPVRFLDRKDNENGHIQLSALFASNFRVERVSFVLPAKNEKNEEAFFEQIKEWEEQIDRQTFLKKFKKNFWLVTYLKAGPDNIMISGHQFKQWEAVKQSYASHPDQFRRSADDLDFWQDMRIKPAFFHAIEGDKAYWVFLETINDSEPYTESDYQTISLANNSTAQKRIPGHSGLDVRILDQGMLFIQKNTVFHKQEIENTKARKMLTFTITDARFRLRPLLIDRKYFVENSPKHFWICFYDSKFQSLVRVVQALGEQVKPE
ncbi:MAG: hypothetical protein G01um101444_502 [Parcubacteria group bacterium Gr01-1014_44]|nr:MAG: hypothetical protein G01um101444_502 [Parcubacteria group bacterium Gr01-1014_44]